MENDKHVEAKVIEIEIGKPNDGEHPHAPMVEIASPPQLITEQPLTNEIGDEQIKQNEGITTIRPPPIHPEIEDHIVEHPSILQPPQFDSDSDITTAKLWKKRDGTAIDENHQIPVRLGLLNDITDFLKINEPKKMPGDKTIRRQRRYIPSTMTAEASQLMSQRLAQKKKIEKKPRKDCACGLDKVEIEKRGKILALLKGLIECKEQEKLDEIYSYVQQIIPTIQFEEEQIEDENGQHEIHEHQVEIPQEGLIQEVEMEIVPQESINVPL